MELQHKKSIQASWQLFFLFLFGFFSLISFPIHAEQLETSVACNELLEPLVLAYGDKTTLCGFESGADEETFTFAGAAGDEITINLRTLTADLDPSMNLRDPSGVVIATGSCVGRDSFNRARTCGFQIIHTMVQDGIYTLALVESGLDEAGDYVLAVERVFPALNPTPLTFDIPVTDRLDPGVDMDFFEFSGAAGDEITINLRTLTADLDPSMNLRDPSGVVIATGSCVGRDSFNRARTCGFQIIHTMVQDGIYTLALVESGLDEAGDYVLAVERVFPALNPTPLTFDIPVTDRLDPGVDMDFFEFSGAAGDEITINLRTLTADLDPSMNLRDPSGVVIATGSCVGRDSFNRARICGFQIIHTMVQDGIYTLALVESGLDEAGDYVLAVERVFPALNPTPLTFDIPVTDRLDPGVDMDFFEFSGAAGDEITINLRTLTADLDPSMNLRDPSGVVIATGSCVGRDSFNRARTCGFQIIHTMVQDGIYTLALVESGLDEAGDYVLAVERVFPALNPTPLTFDIPVTDRLDPGVDMDFFEFSGAAGDEITINLRTLTADLDPSMNLRDPSGVVIATGSCVGRDSFNRARTCGFQIIHTMVQDGIYTLALVESGLDEAGDYVLAVERVFPALNPTPLTFDIPVTDRLDPGVDMDFFEFSGAAGDEITINLRTLTADLDPSMNLRDPSGVVIATGSCVGRDSFNRARTCGFQIIHTMVQDGIYTLALVESGLDEAGDYEITVQCTGVCISPNSPPHVTNPGTQTNQEGDIVSIQIVATDGDTLSYSAAGLPTSLTIDMTTGLISGTIGFDAEGSYPVSISVNDSVNPAVTIEFSWVVTNTNRLPELALIENQIMDEGTTLVVPVSSNDPDVGETLALSITAPPFVSLIDNGDGTGELTMSPGFNDTGLYSVTVTVTDSTGLSVDRVFALTVNDVPPPVPVATPLTIDFGEIVIGSTDYNSILLSNIGGSTLTVNSVTSSGLPFIAYPPVSFDLEAGGERTVPVGFAPETEGTFTSTVTIENNSGTPVTVDISGRGVMPVEPGDIDVVDYLDFGSVGETDTLEKVATITNTGDGPLMIFGAISDLAAFQVSTTVGEQLPYTINPHESRNLLVRFSPPAGSAGTNFTGTLSIMSDDLDESLVTLALLGKAITLIEPPQNNPVLDAHVQVGGAVDLITAASCGNVGGQVTLSSEATSADSFVMNLIDQGGVTASSVSSASRDGAGSVSFSGVDACGLADGVISLHVVYNKAGIELPAVPGTPSVKNTSALEPPVLDPVVPFSLVPIIEVCGTSRADTTVRVEGGARVVSTRLDATTTTFCLPVTLRQNTENTLIASAIDELVPAPKPIASATPVKVVHVDLSQIVIAEAYSRPLTVDEIDELVQQGVISLDEASNFNVSMFTVVLTIGSYPVTISQPVVINPTTGSVSYGRGSPGSSGFSGWLGGATGGGSGATTSSGCVNGCPQVVVITGPSGQTIPGVIIIDGRIKTLKEFFQVTLLLHNISSSFVLSDMSASIGVQDGLTTVGIGLGTDPVDINPAGTAETLLLGEILPGTTGTGQFIIRGDSIGTRFIDVHFDGDITGGGLPTPIPVSGVASTSVEVLGPPQLGVVVRHPSHVGAPDVTENEIYDLIVEITNESDRPALYPSLELFVGGDALLVDENGDPIPERSKIADFGHILPGETVTAGFRVQSLVEGEIIACQAIAAENIMLTVDTGPDGTACNIVNTYPANFVPLDPDHEPVVLAINPLNGQANIPITTSIVAVLTPQTECLIADTWENVVTGPIDPGDPSKGIQVVSADLLQAGTYYLEELNAFGEPVRHIPTDLTVENPPAGGTTIAVLRLGLDTPHPNSQFFLTPDTAYRATILGGADGVCSLASGKTMGNSFSWVFYTGDTTTANNPPVIDPIGDQMVNEGESLIVPVSTTDPDTGDILTLSVNGPAYVTLIDSGNGAGQLSIEPGFEDGGIYPITVTVTDSGGLTDSASFTLTVVDTNRAPVLDPIDDQAVNEGALLSVPLSSGDPDVGDSLTLSVTAPLFVTLIDNGDGSGRLDITPGFTQAGIYAITVTVTDQGGLTDTQSFILTVININLPPALAPIADQTMDEGASLSVFLSASDPDVGDTLVFSVSVPLFVTVVDNGGGSGQLNSNPGFEDAGIYTITVTVTDGQGLSDTQSFTLTVNNTNRPPILDLIGDKAVDEGALLTIQLTASDPDGDSLSFTATGLPGGAELFDNGDGTAQFSWVPDSFQAGSYPVEFIVTDNSVPSTSDSELITISVGNINQPPVLDPIGPQAIEENVELSFLITASDPDGDDLSFSAANLPTGAQLIDNGDGTAQFSWTPSFAQAGNYQVLFLVSDNGVPVASDSEEVTITVGNVNQPPVLDAIGTQLGDENVELSFLITASDPDGDNLSFSAGRLPAGAQLTDNGDGTAQFTWTPNFGQAGNHQVLFIVTDDGIPAASDSEEITITVGDVNRPPVLDAIGSRQVNEGDDLLFTITATDPDGDNLSFTVNSLPTGAYLTDNGDGTALFSWTPSFTQSGNYQVEFVVTDDGVPTASDSEQITITVGNVNRPPVLNPIGDRRVTEDDELSFFVTASDPDGDNLNFMINGLPTGADFVDNGDGTALFYWFTTIGQAGDYLVNFTVADDGVPLLSDSEEITITVEAGGGCGGTIGDICESIVDLSARAKSREVFLMWTPTDGAESYNIYRSTTAGGPYSLIAAGHVCDYCAYYDPSLTNGVTYYYVVNSVNGGAESLHSNEASATLVERTTRTR